jgi:hypothetical protein
MSTAKNQEFVLGALLSDYGERNNDYRRYLKLQLLIWYTIAAIITGYATQVWTSKEEDRHLLYLAGAAIIILALPVHYFIHRKCQLGLSYIMEIELALNKVAKHENATPEGLKPNPIVFYYYVWKWHRGRTVMARFLRTVLFFLALAILLPLQWVLLYNGFHHQAIRPVAENWHLPILADLDGPSLAATIGMSVITVMSLAVFYLSRRGLERHREILIAKTENANEEEELIVPKESITTEVLRKVLLEDFKQRTEDARFLFDNYSRILIFGFAALATVISLWLSNPEPKWPWLLVPPLYLLAAFVDIYNFYLVQRLKRYLNRIETALDNLAVLYGVKPVHTHKDTKFCFGEFRIIRNREIQGTGSIRVPFPLIVINLTVIFGIFALFLIFWRLGASWLDAAVVDTGVMEAFGLEGLKVMFPDASIPSILYLTIVVASVLLLAGFFYVASKAGKDPL